MVEGLMRWKRGHVSQDVIDKRGSGGRGGGLAKLGGGGIVIAIIAVLLGKGDLVSLLGLAGDGAGNKSSTAPAERSEADKELYQFISYVFDDQQNTWVKILPEAGRNYDKAKLVVFEDAVRSACGRQSSAVGPFYCPADQRAYIDLGFYRELAKLGGKGDFAQAYVLAHEIGHHVQNLLGTSMKVHRQKAGLSKSAANALSVKQELQADCYAGIWAHYAEERKMLEMGDLEEGLKAAAAIGDDTLQKRGGGRVRPESWTHGSSEQRVEWFRRGYQSGKISYCDTF